jgi:hypothetical protein
MKYPIHYIGAAVIAAGTLIVGVALAQDKSTPQKPDPKTEEMMKKAEARSTPGPAHKALDPLVGDWNAEVKMWLTPDQPPTVSKGTAKTTWDMKGRFIRQEFTGEAMGRPFQGIGYTGYDNTKEKYNSVWLDDMSTGIVTSEGDATEGGKVLTFGGHYACAMTGEKERPTKQVYRIISRDKHIFEMHDPRQGDKSKIMEITYTRK